MIRPGWLPGLLVGAALAPVCAAGAAGVTSAASSCAEGGSCRPTIALLPISQVTETSATLQASIDPEGSNTTYLVRLKWEPCQHGAGECARPSPLTRAIGRAQLPAGEESVTVSVEVPHLSHGCVYEYRFIARGAGRTESRERYFRTRGQPGLGCSG